MFTEPLRCRDPVDECGGEQIEHLSGPHLGAGLEDGILGPDHRRVADRWTLPPAKLPRTLGA
ncbi:hypothetical protein G7085_04280 [Tessaracoccus sp. HDW20]|uniref:hypothetical protein n=1 Tax=Tessaracoccus coleopterorum TaxID=2714950 RepID=UPI0018D36A31|nr:hypothetical protein [Tessaracoccus coleopterorum]